MFLKHFPFVLKNATLLIYMLHYISILSIVTRKVKQKKEDANSPDYLENYSIAYLTPLL